MKDFDRFMRGDCDAFARALSDLTGGDTHGVFDANGDMHHVFVVSRVTGLAADARGVMDIADVTAGCAGTPPFTTRPVEAKEMLERMGVPDMDAVREATMRILAGHPSWSDTNRDGATTLFIVHPGSVWVSWGAESSLEEFETVTDAITRSIGEAAEIVVIDGSFSSSLPASFGRALDNARANGTPVHRLWGCDSGEPPYRSWVGAGPLADSVFEGQVEAALAVLPLIDDTNDIVLTGAWASRLTDQGCVNSVRDAVAASGAAPVVRISADAAWEESLEGEPEEDPELL